MTGKMEKYFDGKEIVLINTSEIIGIVRCALSKIDPRLIDHGERVGYIADKIGRQSADKGSFDYSKLFILCVLHDIGAYKTNEIDDMVKFETETVFDHSLFGYLFLKNTTYLSEYAEAVLYHHTDYASKVMRESKFGKYAQLIHLADRTDILMNSQNPGLDILRDMAGTKFCPEYVEALLQAEELYGLSDKIRGGGYKAEVEKIAGNLDIKEHEIMDYLKLLVYAIDFRSPYTVTHTADTTIISLETGKLLGLSDHELQALYVGAFLHDIGKIAISHDILEKPGRLNDEEFEAVKKHVSEGEHILRGVVSDEICDIALRHHEKLDGSGYCLGIKGDELTVPQRIVAVADIFSALSQRRSYKEPYPKEKVIGILTEMKDSGKLCPVVVDIVCQNYDMILENTEKSHDPVKTLYSKLISEYAERSAHLRR